MLVEIVYETHSTSVDNERGFATGWLDGELSEAGRRQAEELDLRRLVQTADIAFAGTDVPIHRDRRLRECNYGNLNGRPVARQNAERTGRIEVSFPGGESYRDVVERVRAFLDDLAPEHDGERVLLIGHAATRWALDHLVKGAARTAGRRAVRMAARLGVRPAPKARRVAQVVRKTVSVPSSTTTHSS